uniref:Putative secreted protein n=1 Tax=Amblyomma triste TaxID=251400 RepID=A0A023G173_AMBTT
MCKIWCRFPYLTAVGRLTQVGFSQNNQKHCSIYIHYEMHAHVCSSFNKKLCCQEQKFHRATQQCEQTHPTDTSAVPAFERALGT